MGTDGIPIDEARREEVGDLNIDLVAAEYAATLTRIIKMNAGLELGAMREVNVTVDQLALTFTMVSDEYFLVLMQSPPVGTGRARYELSKARLQLQQEVA